MSYGAAGGVNVSKTLTGRNMAIGEFTFAIAGTDGADGSTTAEEANAKLTAATDKEFTNGAGERRRGQCYEQAWLAVLHASRRRQDVQLSHRRGRWRALERVTYDQSQYRVDISVIDNLDGTMHTLTSVYQTVGADGSVLEQPAQIGEPVDSAAAQAEDYVAPTVSFKKHL